MFFFTSKHLSTVQSSLIHVKEPTILIPIVRMVNRKKKTTKTDDDVCYDGGRHSQITPVKHCYLSHSRCEE